MSIGSRAKKKTQQTHPRSYRFDTETMETLEDTLERVNAVSPKKVSETRLIKALILLSQETDEETLIQWIKQVW